MSIVDDFAAIGGRLAEIEKDQSQAGYRQAQSSADAASSTSWMYTQPVEQSAIVWTPEHGYSIPAIDYDGA